MNSEQVYDKIQTDGMAKTVDFAFLQIADWQNQPDSRFRDSRIGKISRIHENGNCRFGKTGLDHENLHAGFGKNSCFGSIRLHPAGDALTGKQNVL
jgi:hypothetical protein